MKKLYLILLLFFSVAITFAQSNIYRFFDTIPSDLPIPIVNISKSSSEGYIFMTVPWWGSGKPYNVIYDNSGSPVFYKSCAYLSADFKLHNNGLITYYDYHSTQFYIMDSSFSIVDSIKAGNGFTTDEHDIKLLPNGNSILIGFNSILIDMSKIVEGGNPYADVIVNVIQEIDKNKNVIFEWKALDHYKITDVSSSVNLLNAAFLHSHINSIDIDLDGNLIISSRTLNEISKIDKKTGKFIWRMGGKNNQFSFINDTLGFSGQHSVNVLPNGNFLFFDNGISRIPPFSRIAEYKIDTINKSATLVWSYRNNPDIFSPLWGNVQRLENGNSFIGWGYNATSVTEVTPSKEKVFEMKLPKDIYSYRAFRFPVKIKNKLSSVLQENKDIKINMAQNYPNPFNSSTTIFYQLSSDNKVLLKIYNILGREVSTLVNEFQKAGDHRINFLPGNLPSGVYYYKLQAGYFSSVQKMVYLK